MNIDLLSKMVAQLILDNDEVSLPGLGVFVAEMVPSTFSDRGYTINPPYRRLSFRQRAESDSLLVDFYARTNNLSERDAAAILTKFLTELRTILVEKKTVVFPGLGRLRATRENNFFFVPDENLDIYPEGFWLQPVSLKTHEETPAEISYVVNRLDDMLSDVNVAPPELEPTPAPEPAQVLEPQPELEPTPEPTPVPDPDPAPMPQPKPLPSWARTAIAAALSTVATLALALLLFVLIARIRPGAFDSLLYSVEEQAILHYPLD